MVPYLDNLVKTEVTCPIAKFGPANLVSFGLTELGGDVIIIEGENLPHSLEDSKISAKFSDADKTPCVIKTTSKEGFSCETQKFNTLEGVTELTLDIEINGEKVPNTLKFKVKSSDSHINTVVPASASPILKTDIKITFVDTVSFDIAKDKFTVSVGNATYSRLMNVISADDSDKSITCKFGGAWSGVYDFTISHTEFGLLNTKGY